MATNYPTSLDDGTSLPNPAAGNAPSSPSHAAQHSTANDAIKALEAKLGIGSTTPSSTGLLLIPTGAGTTAWTAVTSAQLAASITDETGTGKAVFATSPTLITPAVDTINESTPANGVTVDGLNFKDGKLNTNDSVVTSNITAASVTSTKLGLSSGVTTYTNPGSAGGTNSFFYINLGGLKLFWGQTASIATSGAAPATATGAITLPVGFFSTVQQVTVSTAVASSSQYLVAGYTAASASSITVELMSFSGSNGSSLLNVFVIGT